MLLLPLYLYQYIFHNNSLQIKENGISTYKTTERFSSILLENSESSGSYSTRVIFKFGFSIEKTFTKIANDMYNLQTDDRTENLFAYMFKTGGDRLNYTKVEFVVSTREQNVKFCYISNLGAFIDPSQHNCFRVGTLNPYTITVLNPYVMHKNYKTGKTVIIALGIILVAITFNLSIYLVLI